MKKIIFSTLFACASLLSATDYEANGVKTTYVDPNDTKQEIIIKRDKPSSCNNIKFDPSVVLGGSAASASIPDECKRSFVAFMGKISPMKFSDKVETVGELEVLEFIDKANKDKDMLLIDSRTEDWYYHNTIPSAKNIPYLYLNKSQYPDEFKESLQTMGVSISKDGAYDFSNAKEILLFCNGAWCGQSPMAMKNLKEIGYPEEKMKWYRGGIQNWISFGLPTIKPY